MLADGGVMSDIQTAPTKYVFLDVVGFTRGRSVEAQTAIIDRLNDAVLRAVAELDVSSEQRIFIPTGDGMCIALLGVYTPHDVEMLIALSILAHVDKYNRTCTDSGRRFDLRIGINENLDNLITDINGRRNVAGAGISIAARLMDLADAQQVIVGRGVFDRLRQREKYASAFREFYTTIKHGEMIPVYQYLDFASLVNGNIPIALQQSAPPRLTLELAFYIAHALENRPFLLAHKGSLDDVPAQVTLWFRALDSARQSRARETENVAYQAYNAPNATFAEQFHFYEQLPWGVSALLAEEITTNHCRPFAKLFDDRHALTGFRFVNEEGASRLKVEWPLIWNQFALADLVSTAS
jgi:class 3 adenylate cyclase